MPFAVATGHSALKSSPRLLAFIRRIVTRVGGVSREEIVKLMQMK